MRSVATILAVKVGPLLVIIWSFGWLVGSEFESAEDQRKGEPDSSSEEVAGSGVSFRWIMETLCSHTI